ncbi:GntR family transcriptional regulator [Enterococcus casseliflavus]|uniref:GntR family transcriptional regulator n=1 Tax=Enterococcus casseliflavus TaxID=37734 RepID=UPI0022E8471F|nr:GntR family transcriptional regulator [Enterococcus casseliflavus]
MKKREFIVQDLLSKIYQEEFSAGKLPNQRTLAQTYGVSRFTIQQAIKNLEEIGIVKVVQGSGIFIHEKWVKNPMIFNSLTRTPYDRIHSKMISLNKAAATLDEQQIFQIGPDEKVWIFERVRIVNYKIEQLETSKLPVSLFPELTQEIVEHSIQRYVESCGYRISHYITSYTPITTSTAQSGILLCKRGTPAMQISNRAILEDGRVYEFSNIVAIDYAVTYIRPFDREIHRSRID